MKCPLFVWAKITHFSEEVEIPTECIKEECAWWRDDIQMCANKDISLELSHIQHRLADIVEKMPKWEQFGK